MSVWKSGRKLDERIIQWNQRISRRLGALLGIKSDSELSPADRIQRARRFRRFTERPPIVTDVSDFMSDSDAEAALRRPKRLPASAASCA